MRSQRTKAGIAQRGVVLLAVLVMLLVLSVLVTTLYIEASQSRSLSMGAMNQQIAMMNADRGLQEGIRRIRSGEITPSNIVGTCNATDIRTGCPTGTFLDMGYVDNGKVNPDGGTYWGVEEGAGLQYDYVIYRSGVEGNPVNRYTIRSTGYAALDANSNMFTTVVLEAEIEIQLSGFRCVDAYDCTGGR
ncbi:MAG: hypothetical protein AB1938_01565 [Myxococcota bacterium]